MLLIVVSTGLLLMNGHPSSGQAPSGGGVTFVDVAGERGVARTGLSWGIAWGDFDGDGFVDLYTNNHHLDLPSLYRNNGGRSFSDIAREAGLINRDLHGAAWADYDEDGDLDLYQNVGYRQPNILYRNNGAGTLTNVASQAGVEDNGRGRDVAWADYDRDGDLDFFITNQSGTTNKLFRNRGDGTFVDRTSAAGLDGLSGEAHLWGDYNNDGWVDLLIWHSSVRLYRNNGNGTFTNKSSVLGGVSSSYIKDMDWADYDNDGDLDLYVSRGYQNPGITWNADRIQWHTWFDSGEQGFDWRLSPSSAAMTFDMYYFCGRFARTKVFIGASGANPPSMPFTLGGGQGPDPRGKPPYTPGVDAGVYIWLDQSGVWHLRSTREIDNGHITSSGDFSGVTPRDLTVNPSPISAGNELWENRGGESFVNVTRQANVGETRQSWRALWGDFDNDSDLDLYVSNHGHFLNNEPNTYYVNNGDKTFTEDAAAAGLRAAVGGRGDVAAAADYDRDGFLDIFLTNGASAPGPCRGPQLLFENQGNGNHWLQVRTVGTTSNRDGIGATLALQANGITQYRQQLAGKHANAQDSSLVHFGLGNATTVQSLTITWPSGIRETYADLTVDQIVTLTEGTTPPQAIIDLSGTRASSDLLLAWSPVTQDTLGRPLAPDHYVVYRRADEPYFVPTPSAVIGTPSTPSFTDPGVLGDPAHNYSYLVTAVSDAGIESAPSNRLGTFDLELSPAAQPGGRAYNLVAFNLDVPAVHDADTLASYVGAGAYMVLRHDAATQAIVWRLPGLAGTPFSVAAGDPLFLYVDETAPGVVSWVGDVPPLGTVSYDLARPDSGESCLSNFISVPLHRGDLGDADALAAEIGGVYSVSYYDAETQDLIWRLPGVSGPNFPVRAGYPYVVCLDETAPASWP